MSHEMGAVVLKRNVLTVFLASPGDLQPERNIAREVVERINKVVSRRTDWHIELLGWEDTLPGYSRPQDIINKDVDSCDLFLGLLWKRWGSPTGKDTSGFHEEFLRARERRTSSGIPEIWLFFKTIGSDSLEDPGEQLKNVLNFKKEQVDQKELLFKEFADAQTWERVIHDHLMSYVLDLAQESKETSPDKAMPTTKETGEDVSISAQEKGEDASYPTELGLILEKASRHINGEEGADLDFWDKTRLFLLASSWFSGEHSEERFGVHEINLVYSKRKSWTLSGEETLFIFRTIMADQYDTCPGWYWFRYSEEDFLGDGICWLSATAHDSAVRKRALRLMRQTDYRPSAKVIEKSLSDGESEVVLEAIRLLAERGLSEDIGLLDKVLDSKESKIKSSAVAARLDILYRENPNTAFREYIKVGGEMPIFMDVALQEMNLSVDEDVLLEALKSTHTEVRRFSTSYLRALKKLDREAAESLLEDADSEVRRQALWVLVELGEKITTGRVRKLFPPQKQKRTLFWDFALFGPRSIHEEFFIPILKQTSPEETLASLDTYNSDNEIAYRYIAINHFDLIESRIRSDLDNEFADLISELDQKRWERDTIDFVKAKMIQAALAGLAEHGNEDDVEYARKFLGNTRHNMADPEAVKLIVKYGDASDVKKLLDVALASGTETRQIALEGALELTDDKIPVLETMVREGDGKTAGKAAEKLWVSDENRVRQISKAMLRSEDDYKRLIGLAILFKFCDKTELEALLDEYMEASTYYYNVVTWFDKALYAPGRYGEFFKKELLERL